MGCYEISLGDTIGIGTPEQTYQLMSAIDRIPVSKLAAHFHNTYDRAIPNLIVAMNLGVSVADASVAGIGGCPYAKGASGNVATEDVVYLCELLGIEHGIDLAKLIKVGDYISEQLGRENLASVKAEDLEKLQERREEVHSLFI